MARQFALARYMPDGSLDKSFDEDGKVLTDFTTKLSETADSLVIDSQDRIVVAGVADNNFALARYMPDGSLDPTFDHDGMVLTDFETASREGAHSLAIDSQDRIVVAGDAWILGGWALSVPLYQPDENQFALARYMPDGSLDPSFDGDGKVLTEFFSGSNAGARAVAIDDKDRIVAAGWATVDNSRQFAVARYNSDGSLDTTFGEGGRVVTDFDSSLREEIFALRIDNRGRIVVAGDALVDGRDYEFAMARYNQDGSLDTSFNSTGLVLTDIAAAVHEIAYAMEIDAQNRIVVGGTARVGNTESAHLQFAMARYTDDGQLDTTFDGDGMVLTDFKSSTEEGIRAMVIDNQGRIIVGGWAMLEGHRQFALARYNDDGSLDATFDDDGKVLTNFISSHDEEVTTIGLDSQGRIVVGGWGIV
jgi:uncharacterized delta-60 repeat protein